MEMLRLILEFLGPVALALMGLLKIALNRTMAHLDRVEAKVEAQCRTLGDMQRDLAILMDAKARDQETYRLVIILVEKTKSLEKDLDAAHEKIRITKGE